MKRLGAHIQYILGAVCLTLSITAVINPELRASIRNVFYPDYRKVLALTHARLDTTAAVYEVLKIKTNDGLFLEVYRDGKKVTAAKLPDSKDGYFTFSGKVTNLAVDDINNDHIPEILATSVDSDLVAHLNVYKFSPQENALFSVPLIESN